MTYKRWIHWVGGALLGAAACACSSGDDGIEVAVRVSAKPERSASQKEDATAEFVFSDRGVRVHLDHAFVVVGAVELIPCPKEASLLRQMLRTAFTLPKARAHSETTPTQLGVPYAVDLLAAQTKTIEFEEKLRPPSDSYCKVRIQFEPADRDAEELPEDIELVGRTFYTSGQIEPLDTTVGNEGSVVENGGSQWTYSMNSAAAQSFTIDFDQPLELSSTNRRGRLDFTLDLLALATALTNAQPASPTAGDTALKKFLETLSLHALAGYDFE